jgi:hypothetical protein
MFHLKTRAESSLRNVGLSIRDRTMDNVQNCDNYWYTSVILLSPFSSELIVLLSQNDKSGTPVGHVTIRVSERTTRSMID